MSTFDTESKTSRNYHFIMFSDDGSMAGSLDANGRGKYTVHIEAIRGKGIVECMGYYFYDDDEREAEDFMLGILECPIFAMLRGAK